MTNPRTGQQGLVGKVGTALTDINPTGKIAIRGEYWNARAETMIPKGEKVRVTRIEGLEVTVTPNGGV
jgi:membrane-bound serine protease (ClpP class)